MNRIKQLLRRNIKLIIALLIFVSIGAGVTYSATTYLYNSNVIGYDNSDSGLTATNVQGALDELYDTCVNSTNCPDGYVCHEKIDVLPMFEQNAVSDAVKSTYVSSDTGINFGAVSSDTNGKGLYLLNGSELTGHPIYYYRGAVTNNNVIFANFCWKIVRTTETGGVKLIYNGLPSSGRCMNTTGTGTQLSATSKFNNSTSNYKYIGYTYDNNGVETDSVMKTFIDNWYAANMTSYTSYLEDTIWCNDRSIGVVNGSSTYYGAYIRIMDNKVPSLLCPQLADSYTVSSSNGNGLLTYPVGLLTADEAAYAGGYSGGSSSYYLNTNLGWWLMTPSTGITMMYINNYGTISNYNTSSEFSVRPSVSLKPGMSFISGDGTANSPYVVATN